MAGAIGIRPNEFWELTPFELRCYAEGVADRRDEQMSALAWLQANIINVWAGKGKRVKASQLYRSRKTPTEFFDEETFRAYMRDRQRGEE